MRPGIGPALAGLFLVAACQATTTRPPFTPLPQAPVVELELAQAAGTGIVVNAFTADSLPVAHSDPRDGYVDSGWFDAETLAPAGGIPLGAGTVRIRAWLNPSIPNHVLATFEAVYRPEADPSLPDRELERLLPPEHPIQVRLAGIVAGLEQIYGEPPPPEVTPPVEPSPPPLRTPPE